MSKNDRYAQVMAKYLRLVGKPAHCMIDGDARNIQVLDWPNTDDEEREELHDAFGDVEKENEIGDYIVNSHGNNDVWAPVLRDDVVPFALVVGGSDDPDDMQTEGLLMLDLRKGSGAACPVLYADIDGTIDGNEPFESVANDVAELEPKAGIADSDDEDADADDEEDAED